MAVLLAAHHGIAGNPIKLNHSTRTCERLVAMPRIIAATECQQGAFRWRDFDNHVVNTVSRAQQPKLPAGGFPSGIHINQNRDDFRLRIGMDSAVFFAATAAHRDHVGPVRQIDSELFLERLPKLVATHLLHQLCKSRAVSDIPQRKAAGPIDFRIIVVDRRARFGLHKFRNNQKFKWLAGKRRPAESFQIEHRNHARRYIRKPESPDGISASGRPALTPFQPSRCGAVAHRLHWTCYWSAIRTKVVMMRVPAMNVPRSVPETFDSPPERLR